MDAIAATDYVTQELKEINEIIEQRARELKFKEKQFKEQVEYFDEIKCQALDELQEFANNLYDEAASRIGRAIQENAARVHNVLKKFEQVLRINEKQHEEIALLREKCRNYQHSLTEQKKLLTNEQKNSRNLTQRVTHLQQENERLVELTKKQEKAGKSLAKNKTLPLTYDKTIQTPLAFSLLDKDKNESQSKNGDFISLLNISNEPPKNTSFAVNQSSNTLRTTIQNPTVQWFLNPSSQEHIYPSQDSYNRPHPNNTVNYTQSNERDHVCSSSKLKSVSQDAFKPNEMYSLHGKLVNTSTDPSSSIKLNLGCPNCTNLQNSQNLSTTTTQLPSDSQSTRDNSTTFSCSIPPAPNRTHQIESPLLESEEFQKRKKHSRLTCSHPNMISYTDQLNIQKDQHTSTNSKFVNYKNFIQKTSAAPQNTNYKVVGRQPNFTNTSILTSQDQQISSDENESSDKSTRSHDQLNRHVHQKGWNSSPSLPENNTVMNSTNHHFLNNAATGERSKTTDMYMTQKSKSFTTSSPSPLRRSMLPSSCSIPTSPVNSFFSSNPCRKTKPPTLAEALLNYSSKKNIPLKLNPTNLTTSASPQKSVNPQPPAYSSTSSPLQRLPLIGNDRHLRESAEVLKQLSKRIEDKKPLYLGWLNRVQAAVEQT